MVDRRMVNWKVNLMMFDVGRKWMQHVTTQKTLGPYPPP